MKRLFFYTSFILLLFSCQEKNTNKITFNHHFEKDDTHYFEVTKINYLDSNFKKLNNYTNTLLKISKQSLTKDTSSYTFVYGKSYFKNNGKDIGYSDQEKWIKTSYDNQKVIIIRSKKDGFNKLLNYTECKDFVKEFYLKMLKNEFDSLELKNTEKIENLIVSLTDTEEKILSIYFPEVDLFFKNLNQSFNIDSSYNYTSSVESPFNNNTITGNIKIDFKEKNDTVYIIEKSTPDLENLAEILNTEVDSLTNRIFTNSDSSTLVNPLYYDEFISKYDLNNKNFLEINHIRSISLGDEQKFKHIQLKMVQ